jgi:hypothetical protein
VTTDDDLAKLEADKARIHERTFERGDLCGDCPHYEQWTEHHGEGLNEPLCRCLILDGEAKDCTADDCPGVVIWLTKEREE